MILYYFGLTSRISIMASFALLAIPLIVLMRMQNVSTLKIDKGKVYCRSLYCGAPFEKRPEAGWTYYFPPSQMIIVAALVLLGMMFYSLTLTGRFLITFLHILFPLVAFIF